MQVILADELQNISSAPAHKLVVIYIYSCIHYDLYFPSDVICMNLYIECAVIWWAQTIRASFY